MDLKNLTQVKNDFDNLIVHTKGYMFDSLVFRFKEYQAKCFELEVKDFKYQKCCSELEARERIKDRHNRDLMRFIQILDEAIGEHD